MDADDPIPADAIRLTEAYQIVRRRYIDWDTLVETRDWSERIEDSVNLKTIIDDRIRDESDRTFALDLAERITERFFRSAMADERPQAKVMNPKYDKPRKLLKPEDWIPCGLLAGITSDFVDPDDLYCPGPDSTIGNVRRPVFFIRAEFDAWLEASVGPAPLPCAANGKSRPGAKPSFDWPDIEQFVFKTLDHNGDFDHIDAPDDWKSQNCLIKEVISYIERPGGKINAPSDSTLKARIAPMVARWRSKPPAGN
jgi:hypothetical protein